MKTKIIAIVLCIALMAGVFSGCNGKDEDTIKIGMIGPLTGEVAQYGTAVLKAVELYVEQYNADGGLNGKMIEIIDYDDKHDATEATNAYNRLATSDEVIAIIGAVTSTPTIAVAQASLDDRMPLMTPTATHPDVTSFGDNMFRACFLDPFQGSTMAGYAKNELGAATAAVIYNNSDAYSTGLYESFVETAGELGLEIVATESYAGTDTDYQTQLTNIASKNPDVIFAPDYYNNLYLVMSQAKSAGITAKFLGVDGADGILGIEGVDTSVVEGLYFANHYSTEDQADVVQNFLTGYRDEYDEDPSALAALGYDAAMIMIAALEEVAADMELEPTKEVYEAIIAALKETDIEAVTGNITYDENNNPQKTCAIILVKDGEYTLDSKY